MDILLVVIGFLFVIIGILGSFLPVLPGAPISWAGLLLLYLTKAIPNNWWLLGITLAVAIGVVVADYIIPVAGTKRFGGSKYGMIGTTVGLIVSIIFPIFAFHYFVCLAQAWANRPARKPDFGGRGPPGPPHYT